VIARQGLIEGRRGLGCEVCFGRGYAGYILSWGVFFWAWFRWGGPVCEVLRDGVFWTGLLFLDVVMLRWLYFVVESVFFRCGSSRSIIDLSAFFLGDISRDVVLHRYPVQHGMIIVPHVSCRYFAFFVQGGEWLSGACFCGVAI
jgi:hypothetical protein